MQKVRLLADGKNGEIPCSAHMQMTAGAGDPVPKPPPTALPSPSPSRAGGSPCCPHPGHHHGRLGPLKPVHPGDVLVTGHGCVPRAALTAHSLSIHLGGLCPCPARQTHPPEGPTLWSQRSLSWSHIQARPHQDPKDQGCPMELITSSLLGPRKSGRRLCQGPRRQELVGGDGRLSVLCHAGLVPVPTAENWALCCWDCADAVWPGLA